MLVTTNISIQLVLFLALATAFAAFLTANKVTGTETGRQDVNGTNDIAVGRNARTVVFLTDGVDLTSGRCPLADGNGDDDSDDNIDDSQRIPGGDKLQYAMTLVVDVVAEALVAEKRGIDVKILESYPCGDSLMAVRKLLTVLADQRVAGVVTSLASSSVKAVSGVVESFRLPMMQLVTGDITVAASTYEHHYIVPHYGFHQIQIFLDIAKQFNWTSVSTLNIDTGHAVMYPRVQVFQTLVSHHHLCVIPPTISPSVPTFRFNQIYNNKSRHMSWSPSPIVLFRSGDEDSDILRTENKNVDVLELSFTHTQWDNVFPNFSINCGLGPAANQSSKGELRQKHDALCDYMESLESSRKLDLILNGGNLLSALSFILHQGNGSSASVCKDRVNTCPLLDGIYTVDTMSKTVTPGMGDYSVYHYKSEGMVKQQLNLPVEKSEYPTLHNKGCGELCHLCYKCFPEQQSLSNVMVSTLSYPYKIVGLFPVHRENCNDLSIEGISQALTFLSTVEMMNTKFGLTNSKGKVQGVVVDSCGSWSRADSIIHEVQGCRYSYPVMTGNNGTELKGGNLLTLQPNYILGYFVKQSNNLPLNRVSDMTRSIITVDDAGYSSNNDVHTIFINHLVDTLVSLKWTVVNVLVSQEEYFLTMGRLMKDRELYGQFCVVNIIELNNAKEEGLDFFHSISKASLQTSVFILLTTKEDTRMLFNRLVTGTLDKKFQFVFTPWNYILVDLALQTELSDANLMLEPSIDEPFILGGISSMKDLMSMYPDVSQFLHNNNQSVDETILEDYPHLQVLQSSVIDLINEWHLSETTEVDNGRESAALHVFVKYSKHALKEFIGKINKTLSLSVDPRLRLDPHNQCQSWCPSCNICSGKPQTRVTHFYRPGDLIITGLFPFHDRGTKAFQCEKIRDSGDSGMSLASAFIFAIDTIKLRYPNLLSGLSLGGLLLDSCSDSWLAARTLTDFESCNINIVTGADKLSGSPNPNQNLAYFIQEELIQSDFMNSVIDDLDYQKFGIIPTNTHDDHDLGTAVVKTIQSLGWNHAVMLIENGDYHEMCSQHVLSASNEFSLCVTFSQIIESGQEWTIGEILEPFYKYPVIVVAQQNFVRSMFQWLGEMARDFVWFVAVSSDDWYKSGIITPAPPGTFFVRYPSRSFQDYAGDQMVSHSHWMKEFWKFRYSCDYSSPQNLCPEITYDSVTSGPPSRLISSVIRMVDAVAYKLNEAHVKQCERQPGVCKELLPGILSHSLGVWNVSFPFQGEMVRYDEGGKLYQTLSILVPQPSGLGRVGLYFSGQLDLDMKRINDIVPDTGLNGSNIQCESCQCLFNDVNTDSDTDSDTLADYIYHTNQREFIHTIWTKVFLAISCSGVFISLCLVSYVMYKVCKKTIGIRYVRLGQFLLISLISLYLSVIPYLLTPSEVICGLRYLLPAISFALCFAGVLVKLMTLQSYRQIGLGGEVSWVNQFLTVFFIVGVQIAISVQRWHYNSPMMYSVLDRDDDVKYACHFSKLNFCLHYVYNLLLLLMSSLYAIAVRNEKKNLGEAKLLLISCWLCVVIWVACPLCLFLLDDFYTGKVICIAVLACACILHLVIFIPKLQMVARLKYSVSQRQNLQNQNDYNVDSDFLYERPFSMPGTLSSTFSTLNKNSFPKTISAVDLDVNY